MKRLIYLFPFVFFACETPQADVNGGGANNDASQGDQIIDLNNKVRALELELSTKDESLNDFIETYNEIQDNLASINLKEDEIRIRSNNTEMGEDGKQWILQEIKNINYLREENENKIGLLNNALKKSKSANKELSESNDRLTELVTRLQRQILGQEEEINSLKQQLEELDTEYTELFEAYQEQTELALDVMKEMNEVYYSYGSLNELKDNKVLIEKGGFIGIGRSNMLRDNFNEDYFTKVDMYKVTEIPVIGRRIRIATDHPSSSYKIVEDGEKKTIVIEDPTNFWKISKYLVVVVK
jgi:hypothetical protein